MILNNIAERPYDVVMDETIPIEETALVRFMIDMKSFNGIDISKTWYIDNSRVPHVQLPAGQADMIFNAYIVNGNVTHIARDVEINYFFEPGKSYTVKWDLEKKPKVFLKDQEYIYGINIFDGIVKNPNKKKRIEYIPLFDTEERFGR
jgi:hypothetical protein